MPVATDQAKRLIIAEEAALEVAPAGWLQQATTVISLGSTHTPDADTIGRGIFFDHDLVLSLIRDQGALLTLNTGIAWAALPWFVGQPLGNNYRLQMLSGAGPCYACLQHHDDWQSWPEDPCSGWPLSSPPPAADANTWSAIWTALGSALAAPDPGMEITHQASLNRELARRFASHPDCQLHAQWPTPAVLTGITTNSTVSELVMAVRAHLGADAVVEPRRQLVRSLQCPRGHHEQPALAPLSRLQPACPLCGSRQTPRLLLALGLEADIFPHKLRALGLPADDVFIGRSGLDMGLWRLDN